MHIYCFRYEPALLVAAVQIAVCACCGDKHNDIASGNQGVDKFFSLVCVCLACCTRFGRCLVRHRMKLQLPEVA